MIECLQPPKLREQNKYPRPRYQQCYYSAHHNCRHQPEPHRAKPDTNYSPNSFDAPMNTKLTALTRPRMASGSSNCMSSMQLYSLTISSDPGSTKATIATQKCRIRPKTTVAAPNTATPDNIQAPTRQSLSLNASQRAHRPDPLPGTARKYPKTSGPECTMFCVHAGSSAVAPPNNTAKRSSEMAPNTVFRRQTKRNPSSSGSQETAERTPPQRHQRGQPRLGPSNGRHVKRGGPQGNRVTEQCSRATAR